MFEREPNFNNYVYKIEQYSHPIGPIVTEINSNTIAKCFNSKMNPNVSTELGHKRLRPPPAPLPPPPPDDDDPSSSLIILPSGPILVPLFIDAINCTLELLPSFSIIIIMLLLAAVHENEANRPK